MKKKVVYPPCPATISGKHSWIELNSEEHPHVTFEHPVCEYCEITDDTVTLKQEIQQEGKIAYS